MQFFSDAHIDFESIGNLVSDNFRNKKMFCGISIKEIFDFSSEQLSKKLAIKKNKISSSF